MIAVALKTWPIKMDFGQPNVEIVLKMFNGRQLFLALVFACVYMYIYICYMINTAHTHTRKCTHAMTHLYTQIHIRTCTH